MPLHDYQCPHCKHQLTDQWSSFTDAVNPSCPQCGKLMQMVYSAPALKFIGDGFHCNDYGKPREKEDE